MCPNQETAKIYSRDTNETYILHRHLKYSRHFRHPPDTNKTPMDTKFNKVVRMSNLESYHWPITAFNQILNNGMSRELPLAMDSSGWWVLFLATWFLPS